jgi:XTP/dITP diphosphohydrolase
MPFVLAPGTPLLVATTNPGKLREMRAMLDDLPLDVRALDPARAVEAPEETGATFADNARLKATHYARATGLLTVADDSGLEIDALDGRPGVHSARYPGASYVERFAGLYAELARVPDAPRTARFVCVVALASPEAIVFEGRGIVEGEIVDRPRGDKGFGYDPIFLHRRSGRTLAELDGEDKARISHRGAALRELRAFLVGSLSQAGA